MKVILFLSLVMLSVEASALRNTSSDSYTDPDYENYQLGKVVLITENMSIEASRESEKRLTRDFKKKGITVVPYKKLFPPTRDWSVEARTKIYEREGINSVLILTGGASSSSVIPIATQSISSGTEYSYSNSTNYSGSSTTYNVLAVKSRAEFSAIVFDLKNQRVAWYADILSKASGTLFVNEKGDGKGAAKEVFKALIRDGHLPK